MVRSEENEIVGLYCGSRFISLREATGKEPDALPVYAATPTGDDGRAYRAHSEKDE